MDREVILLRVMGTCKLPQDDDAIKTKLDSYQNLTELYPTQGREDFDAITKNKLQFGGLTCRVLGTFYMKNSELHLGSDIETFSVSMRMGVYFPKGDALERNSFRLAMDEALYKQRFIESDPRTSVRTTLFYIAAHRTGKLHSDTPNRLFLHKCPTCEAEMIEVWDIPEVQKCPHCGERVYPSDCLRIWEELHDSASNQLALTRFTNAIIIWKVVCV